ncbi:hypothetical protein [Grimontia sp. SpTr1]|nr:hypothetical protein [Grimontia sp. SpTr1]
MNQSFAHNNDPNGKRNVWHLGKRSKGDGFIGWIDDFKVISRALTQEEYCNHARGTLVRIRENVFWNRIASRYPESSHKAIAEQVGDDGPVRYACYVNYNVERGANMAQIPRGTESLREEVLDIHRLAFNEARPDSSENAFCKSCHVESDGPLSLQALKYLGLPAQEDDRRQPMQPNPLIYGIIPPNLFGPGLPVRRINDDVRQKKPRGHFVDEWVLDNSQ